MADRQRLRGSEDGEKPDMRFGKFAEGYDAARPEYPSEAVAWLLEGVDGPIAELGAGTGKLTRQLVQLGYHVLAVEPDAAMIDLLHRRVPDAVPIRALAEALPFADSTVGAVIAAQAWHWFDADRAWSSALRVLVPRGQMAVVWNAPSLRVPWQRGIASLGPTISPVTEHWWPAGIPDGPMERQLFRWRELLTPHQVREEYATHLAVRRLAPVDRHSYLDNVQKLAHRAARSRRDGLASFERLTWCARLLDR